MSGARLSRAASLIGVLACAACIAAPAHAAFPGLNGKIAFERTPGEIWAMNPDGTGAQRLTERPPDFSSDPSWSPDGAGIAFQRGSDLWVMAASGIGQTEVTPDCFLGCDFREQPAWSPDMTMLASRDGVVDIVTGARRDPGAGEDPSWSPDGTLIAGSHLGEEFNPVRGIFLREFGGPETRLTTGEHHHPDWSPDGERLVFADAEDPGGLLTVVPGSGSPPTGVANSVRFDSQPVWSPDGEWLAFTGGASGEDREIFIMRPDGTQRTQLTDNEIEDANPTWQPAPPAPPDPGYPRPKGASPVRVPLVPAYRACESPNRAHAPPLAFGSCAPPVPESEYLTVGTPDANGAPAKSLGLVRFGVLAGDTSTTRDEADVRIRTEITDVRCRIAFNPCESGQYSDYTGEVQGTVPIRITDRYTLPVPGQRAVTVQDILTFTWTVPCAATADTTVGATCALNTTADALLPGSIGERMRANWEFDRVAVRDGGADGEAHSDDFTVFAVQGIFVP